MKGGVAELIVSLLVVGLLLLWGRGLPDKAGKGGSRSSMLTDVEDASGDSGLKET
eukprot:COSAG02_NODE_30095_length_557_cov_0.982533_1_plen_54_part_10